jgi:hypothetical protein
MRYVTVRFPVADDVDVGDQRSLRRAMIWARNPEVSGVVEVPDELEPLPPIHGHDPMEGVEVVVTTKDRTIAKQQFAIRHGHSKMPDKVKDKPRGPR